MPRSVYRIDDHTMMAEKRAEWTAFSKGCSLAAPFCHPGVWMSWLEAFAEYEPVIFELRDGSGLLALLPFYLEGTTLRPATGPHIDYQDIAAVSDEAAVELLVAVIQHAGDRGLMLTFDKVAEHSRLRVAIDDARVAELASVQRRYWSLCPSATVEIRGPGRFLESFSSNRRRDFTVASRRITEAFPDHVIEHHFGSGIDTALLSEAARLHLENQYRREGESVFTDHRFTSFLVNQAAVDAPLLLSMIWARPGGEPMAFNLGYFAENTYFYYITAYDGAFVSLSPGKRLFIDTLSHCADRVGQGRLRYDLLSGEENYKSRWANSFYEVERIQVIPKRLANLPRVAAYSALYTLKSAKNRLLKWKAGGERVAGLQHEPPVLAR